MKERGPFFELWSLPSVKEEMPAHGITSFGEVWGAGWAEAHNGQHEALKNELRGCALFPAPGFKLEYEQNLDNNDKHGDGREWTAYFRTGVGQRKCTGHQ